MRYSMLLAALVCSTVYGGTSMGQERAAAGALAKMPVREITVFKDGHAFVLHEGAMPTDDKGNVVMDYLPTPVIGTFWPFTSERNGKLVSVVAGRRKLMVERPGVTVRELLEANPGADVLITETGSTRYPATIIGFPKQEIDESAQRPFDPTDPFFEPQSRPRPATSSSRDRLAAAPQVILLKTEDGVKVVALDRIQDVTFRGPHKTRLAVEESRNMLTLNLDWAGKPAKSAAVGLLYVQKGVRWIPNYKVTLDGKGSAVVKLQATLLNELTDLDDVTANLVIGVPTFAFKETPDPIALQETFATLSRFFQEGGSGRTANAFSNAIMTQAARSTEIRQGQDDGLGPVGAELLESAKSEDLFVFTAKHISLKKGERMVLPVAEFSLKYEDVYTLDLPFGPPQEVRGTLNSGQAAEIAKLLAAPKVTHKIRLANKSDFPLTTAPALILREGRVLAQGMMTYTAIGGSTDLAITTAVDIQVRKSETETKRTLKALQFQGSDYSQIELTGKISLTNFRSKPVEIEVTRHVLGLVDSADHDAAIQKSNVMEDDGHLATADTPHWWSWYGWPAWWHHLNGVGRITWKVKLEPGKSVDLGYTWHYFWR